MEPRALVRLAAALLLLSACDSAPRGSLVLELAPTVPTDEMGTSCTQQATTFGDNLGCLRLQICASGALPGDSDGGAAPDAGSGEPCVEITLPGGNHDDADNELIVSGRGRAISFDARVDPSRRYDVFVTAYDTAGSPIATGRTNYVRPLEDELRVRLHTYGVASCVGLNDTGGLASHRAFGSAIPLPNGDVLFFGGVTGRAIPASQLVGSTRFQRNVEVYDVSEARFHSVTVENTADAGGGLARVLFEARDYGTTSDGRQQIRIFGGFTSANPDALALRFDQNLVYTAYGLPLLPGVEPAAASTADLFYDPVTRTARVVLVETGITGAASGGSAVSEVVDGSAVSVGGLRTNGGATMLAFPEMVAPTVSETLLQWNQTTLVASYPLGDPPLDFGRYGATVSHLGGSSYLVWGGAIRVPTPPLPTGMEYLEQAGVFIDLPSGSRTISAIAALPDAPPIAFHTATRLSDDHVMIAGGVSIVRSFSAAQPTLQLTPAPPGLTVLVREAGAFRATPVAGVRSATILHQATVLSERSDGVSTVLFTGGALTQPFPTGGTTLTTFWASSEVGLARGSADSWSYAAVTPLRRRRFGHTTTVIPGVGVLVSGGYREESSEVVTLQPVVDAELILVEDLLGVPRPPSVTCGDAGPRDAARTPDGGAPDAGAPDAPISPPDDAGEMDAPDFPDAPV